MERPTISLCMIVKNEEKHLSGCLKSVRGMVDQVVIVDTGSTDGTVDIASSYGAEVFFFPWCNDFSAARNESLRHAKSEWILWLDADERLNCVDTPHCLIEKASTPGVDAYWVPIRSPKPDEGYDFHYAIRFFRRFPGIHFVGEVHELVDPFLLERGANIVRAQFVIEHLGYAVDSSKMEEKLERNMLLLRKSFERDPDNAYILYCLGRTLLGLKKKHESMDTLERALQGKGLTPNLHASVLNLITFFHLSDQDYVKAEETALESLDAVQHQNTARLLLGISYYNQKRYELALPCLFQAYQFHRLPPEKRMTEITEEHSFSETDTIRALAISFAKLGHYGEAIAFFHRYLKQMPKDPEVTRMIGMSYLNSRDFAQAAFYLKQAESMGMAPALLALPLACAYFNLGDMQQVQEYLLEAEENNLRSAEGEALLECIVSYYFESNRAHEAYRLLERLALRYPFHPKILDALGVACIKEGDLRKAIEAHKALLALTPANPEVIRRLSGIFVKIGDLSNARRWLAKL